MMYLSEYYPTWPCKYYDNSNGLSIASMTRCETERQRKAYMDHLPEMDRQAMKSGEEHQKYIKSDPMTMEASESKVQKMGKMKEEYKQMKHMYQQKKEAYKKYKGGMMY